jgi:penicillin-binding protein 1B
MVVLDPHTGAVLALVGGRDYGFSQLNPRSIEAPHRLDLQALRLRHCHEHRARWFATVITPASTVTDAPSSFAYGDQIYEPRNYKEEYHGDVTLRYALAMSLNNATVKVAEEVGYDKVADLAKSAESPP